MRLLMVATVLLAGWSHLTRAITLYGACPRLLPNVYEEFRIKPFEGKGSELLYFSNVRFEALFDGRLEGEEWYWSAYAIALEQQDECFQPFRLEPKASFVDMPHQSVRRGALTLINTVVLALHETSYLLAFSCVQVGHTKLEYVWIFSRAGQFGRVGLEKVRQMFDPWLGNISTTYRDLRRTHHELPFCTSILWSAIGAGVVSVLALLILTTSIVCWKKHKQILQLRRSSCAECEYPMEELDDAGSEGPRDITSARTIAVMNGIVM